MPVSPQRQHGRKRRAPGQSGVDPLTKSSRKRRQNLLMNPSGKTLRWRAVIRLFCDRSFAMNGGRCRRLRVRRRDRPTGCWRPRGTQGGGSA